MRNLSYVERPPELNQPDGVCGAAFTLRVPGVDVKSDKAEVLRRLKRSHEAAIEQMGLGERRYCHADQVHGGHVAEVSAKLPGEMPVPATDGLVTSDPSCLLGIYVADCCAVYCVDPVRKAIGLSHSGRKGTEANITGQMITALVEGGSDPSDMIVLLSPCIRPPQYEVDFAAAIRDQARAAGVPTIVDQGENTAADLEKFYSYRMEEGQTGRMLALLWLK